jgi:glycosyltransferase involved in cell wall biosynthesis
VLQPLARRALPAAVRSKAHVIVQSAAAARGRHRARGGGFQVAVLAHLRPVKDPLLAARAVRLLPPSSQVRVLHLGAGLDERSARGARAESRTNPRYAWAGPRPRAQALKVLARSRLLVVTSRLEGGANVVSEALASSIPVVSTRIPGSMGILGAGYPGYFRPGDAADLARLLRRAETEPAFYERLGAWCRRLRPLVAPARERAAWRALLSVLGRRRLDSALRRA